MTPTFLTPPLKGFNYAAIPSRYGLKETTMQLYIQFEDDFSVGEGTDDELCLVYKTPDGYHVSGDAASSPDGEYLGVLSNGRRAVTLGELRKEFA